MTDPIVQDRTIRTNAPEGPITMLNRFTTKPGEVDAFVAAQTAEYVRLKGLVPGWLGNRLLRAIDGTHLVNVADFASHAEYTAWRDSALFAEHLEVIRPFIVKAEPALYTVLYEAVAN